MTTDLLDSPAPTRREGPAADSNKQTLLVLGASGDLTGRLLLPGLARLVADGAVPGLSLLGSGADDWDDERWRRRVTDSFAAADSVPAGTREVDGRRLPAYVDEAGVSPARGTETLAESVGPDDSLLGMDA